MATIVKYDLLPSNYNERSSRRTCNKCIEQSSAVTITYYIQIDFDAFDIALNQIKYCSMTNNEMRERNRKRHSVIAEERFLSSS